MSVSQYSNVSEMAGASIRDESYSSAGSATRNDAYQPAFPSGLDVRQLQHVADLDSPTSRFYAGPEGLCLVEAVEVARASAIDLDGVLQRIERKLIKFALEKAGGARASAARMMGISRSRLYRRIHALGLDKDGGGNHDVRS